MTDENNTGDELTELLAEDTELTPEELERAAEDFEIGALEDAEWECTEPHSDK